VHCPRRMGRPERGLRPRRRPGSQETCPRPRGIAFADKGVPGMRVFTGPRPAAGGCRVHRLLILALGAALLLAAACGGGSGSPPPDPDGRASGPGADSDSGYPYTFTDDAGRTVTVARRPERIITLAPSHSEVLFAIG